MTALLALLLSGTMSGDQPPAPIAPSTKWNIEYADSQCVLSRSFGTGPGRVTFGVSTMPAKRSVDLMVVEPARALKAPRQVTLAITAPDDATARDAEAAAAPAAQGRVTRASIPRDRFDRLKSAARIDLTIDGWKTSLALAGTAAAFDALAGCEADLLRSWGYDPQVQARLRSMPEPAEFPGRWVSDYDYPAGSLRRRHKGPVIFRLDIDATGAVQGCTVLQSSGYAELDETVCVNMRRRARFKPARDASGVAHPSLFVSRFTWRLP